LPLQEVAQYRQILLAFVGSGMAGSMRTIRVIHRCAFFRKPAESIALNPDLRGVSIHHRTASGRTQTQVGDKGRRRPRSRRDTTRSRHRGAAATKSDRRRRRRVRDSMDHAGAFRDDNGISAAPRFTGRLPPSFRESTYAQLRPSRAQRQATNQSSHSRKTRAERKIA
jgi:hypothetical protein